MKDFASERMLNLEDRQNFYDLSKECVTELNNYALLTQNTMSKQNNLSKLKLLTGCLQSSTIITDYVGILDIKLKCLHVNQAKIIKGVMLSLLCV